ncbi:PfkB family carbohydrate kinase [Jannaschia seohaensis]|uniref:Ribokinase n=1 Tax=Jannaschia seohaensis TaxID=475081 RepID=A0A2Y9B7P6_9RHOB|nr:PfkB family carbohydrate kinase [Jannaschia seohaensis]PWJ12526.1 ribokinase [Jannaschia seohaensis]SSA51007.1 ribokinase [Jannaschia seohaensis]
MILVLGSLHWDVVVRAPRLPALDETLPGQGVDYRFGGKGGNQARAAARAGARVAFAGAVGRDDPGARMRATLAAEGVDTSRLRQVDAPSGMSVAIETETGDYGAVVVTGANALAMPSDPTGVTTALIQNEVPEAANLALARALPADARLILNAAPARPVPPDLLARLDLLIVNRVEAGQMGAAAFGNWVTVVTRGAEGLDLHRDGTVHRMAAPRVDVVSTHGAGDVFCGTLAAGLDLGCALETALEQAQAEAARHVSTAR